MKTLCELEEVKCGMTEFVAGKKQMVSVLVLVLGSTSTTNPENQLLLTLWCGGSDTGLVALLRTGGVIVVQRQMRVRQGCCDVL